MAAVASRPSLSLFPPADQKTRRRDSQRSASAPGRRPSVERSKSPNNYHEMVIQVPAPTHQAPVQAQYPAPQQYQGPVRRQTASPRRDSIEGSYAPPVAVSNTAVPNFSRFPTRTASLGSRLQTRNQTPPPRPGTREDSAVATPDTPKAHAPAVSQSPQRSQPTRARTPVYQLEQQTVSPLTPENTNASPFGGPIRSLSNRTRSPVYPHDRRVGSPDSQMSASPTLVRSMSGRTATRSPVSPEEFIPMQSMFPQYNPDVPLANQEYRPTRDVASPAQLPMDKISKSPYSPPPGADGPSTQQFITPASELENLWNSANGQPVSPAGPQIFSLQLNRPSESAKSKKSSSKERPPITFGATPKEPFYSLRQSNLEPEIVTDPSGRQHALEGHELLVFRHHPSRTDILPIAHMDITPPPPPSLSTTRSIPVANSSGFPMDVEANAVDASHLPHHITTFSPTLATLTSLQATANSPAGSCLAMVDPNANSAEARRLAENAVRTAEEQESVELLWRRITPSVGVYELLHPGLGVLHFRIDGDVRGKLDCGAPPHQRARISLLNPYRRSSEHKYEYVAGPSSSAAGGAGAGDDEVLASLDLAAGGMLDVNATACQALRNPYLVDVAVCSVFAVAVAESRRQEDPGLKFDAPPSPPKPASAAPSKPTSKLQKKTKESRVREDGTEELPRGTRAFLGLLRVLGKSLIWFIGLGLRMMLAILRGVTKCFR